MTGKRHLFAFATLVLLFVGADAKKGWAQTSIDMERTAFTCAQLPVPDDYANLEQLGWERLNATEMTDADVRAIASAYLLIHASRDVSPSALQQKMIAAETRARQSISRATSSLELFDGAFFRDGSSGSLLTVEIKNLPRFTQVTCGIFLTPGSATLIQSVADRNGVSRSDISPLVMLVGELSDVSEDQVELKVQLHLWERLLTAAYLERDFDVEGYIYSTAWRHGPRDE